MLEKIIAGLIIIIFVYYIFNKIKKVKNLSEEDNPCAGCSKDCSTRKNNK